MNPDWYEQMKPGKWYALSDMEESSCQEIIDAVASGRLEMKTEQLPDEPEGHNEYYFRRPEAPDAKS